MPGVEHIQTGALTLVGAYSKSPLDSSVLLCHSTINAQNRHNPVGLPRKSDPQAADRQKLYAPRYRPR